MPEVRVYTTTQCPYCRMVKAFLEKRGIRYSEINVSQDREAAGEMIRISGQNGVPVTVAGDRIIVGFDTQALSEVFGPGIEAPVDVYDVVILGAGPAGLAAAVYTARKYLKTLVIAENIGGQALESWAIENYMGYRMITGEDLMKRFEEQAKELHIQLELDGVLAVSRDGSSFTVKTATDRSFGAKCLIIATGKHPRMLGIPGEEKFIGRGLSICATCDGPLFKGKAVAVVGGGNSALQTAIEMAKIAKTVHLVVRSQIRCDEILKDIYQKKENILTHLNVEVARLYGDQFLTGLGLKHRDTGEEARIDVEGVFLEIGWLPNTEFLEGFVPLNAGKEIVVDENCHTAVAGVFAAGDVTSIKGKQIIIAAGEGAKAALEAYEYLVRTGAG
ncbi:MAG TPA: Uxx-star family glutaredoxin-like (seleno)protein [Methanomicrobiales archaeon]|jgi:alkyl hydroperoxide reductase subunit F|nr:Uxx-star family glutaredoxin-like (seleno)protein [Methanomicrobiales archaeon]